MTSTHTLYQRATAEIHDIVLVMLNLSERSNNFSSPPLSVWQNELESKFLLGGLGYHQNNIPSMESRPNAWLARSAVPFSIENAATGVLYERLSPFIDEMIQAAFSQTQNFTNATSEWRAADPFSQMGLSADFALA